MKVTTWAIITFGLGILGACGQYESLESNNVSDRPAIDAASPAKSNYTRSWPTDDEEVGDLETDFIDDSDIISRNIAAVQANAELAVVSPKPMASFVYAINPAAKWTGTPAVIFVDVFDTTAKKVADLKKKGQTVICYFSAGTRESWRSDKNKFPSAAVGKKMEEWDGEYWIDYRNSTIRSIMKARIEMAKTKGCQGVDPDNVDGHLNKTGFPLKAADQASYIAFMAQEARARGMSIGLKNSAETAAKLAASVDFAVVEECHAYNECGSYAAFTKAGKAIFQIEYRSMNTSLCNKAKTQKATLIFSDYDLKSFKACN